MPIEEEEVFGKVKSAPLPSPYGYKFRAPVALHTQMIFIWTTLNNFSSFLGIPLIGLEFLEDVLTGISRDVKKDPNNNDNNDEDDEREVPIYDNVMLREIHSSLLTKILIDKIKNRSAIKFKVFDETTNDFEEDKVPLSFY